jgi:hypothetical protein
MGIVKTLMMLPFVAQYFSFRKNQIGWSHQKRSCSKVSRSARIYLKGTMEATEQIILEILTFDRRT